jgi:peptide/nickel transport system ATP-binding protein
MSDSLTTRPEVSDEEHSETLLEVRDLRTYYDDGGVFGSNPVKAVDGVSFDLRRGETLGLVGESGCGKTTLGRTLIRLERATDGEITFDGTDVTSLSGGDLKAWRRNAQIVFQDPESSLNSRMTVGEIIREPLDVHDWETPQDRRDRVRELLTTVGLREEHYYRYPHQFSGGQRQRVGIARALALSPDFLVLDEPVSALDVSVQAKILNLLEDLQEEFGLTYLFIAHDLSVVRHLCDRVAVMYLGHIMEIGNTEELFDAPANPYTHSLLSAIPEPDPASGGDRITLRGTPPSPRDPPQGCPFATRCPAKVRPDAFADLDDDLWERIEIFREVLRERARADRSLSERARELLGLETRFSSIEEIDTEVFGDATVPSRVREAIDRASALVSDGEDERAREHLRETFGSECDRERPALHEVSQTGRVSLCHRHTSDQQSPEVFLETHTHGRGGRRQ